jgi:hypothetical protein
VTFWRPIFDFLRAAFPDLAQLVLEAAQETLCFGGARPAAVKRAMRAFCSMTMSCATA